MVCRQNLDGTFNCTAEKGVLRPEGGDDGGILRKIGGFLSQVLGAAVDVAVTAAPIVISNLTQNHDSHLLFDPNDRSFEIRQTPLIKLLPNQEFATQTQLQQETERPSLGILKALEEIERRTQKPIKITTNLNRAMSQRTVQSITQGGLPQTPFTRRQLNRSQGETTFIANNPSSAGFASGLDNPIRNQRPLIQEERSLQNNLTQQALRQEGKLRQQETQVLQAQYKNLEARRQEIRKINEKQRCQQQIRAAARTPNFSNQSPLRSSLSGLEELPVSTFKNQNLTERFQSGLPFTSEAEWKQFTHTMSLEHLKLLRVGKEQEAEQFEQQIKETAVAILTGPNALRHKDGYIIIGNKAYGTFEAEEKAEDFIEHLLEHESYPPLKYPSNPNLPLSAYPDVTKQVNNFLDEMSKTAQQESKKGFLQGTKPLFERMFDNNQPWDFQVGRELPGQVLKNNKVQYDADGKIITVDQYAIFGDKVHRAGYISNYVLGYTAASASVSESFIINIARAKALLGGKDGDNPKDIEAIKVGWKAYWVSHANGKN